MSTGLSGESEAAENKISPGGTEGVLPMAGRSDPGVCKASSAERTCLTAPYICGLNQQGTADKQNEQELVGLMDGRADSQVGRLMCKWMDRQIDTQKESV